MTDGICSPPSRRGPSSRRRLSGRTALHDLRSRRPPANTISQCSAGRRRVLYASLGSVEAFDPAPDDSIFMYQVMYIISRLLTPFSRAGELPFPGPGHDLATTSTPLAHDLRLQTCRPVVSPLLQMPHPFLHLITVQRERIYAIFSAFCHRPYCVRRPLRPTAARPGVERSGRMRGEGHFRLDSRTMSRQSRPAIVPTAPRVCRVKSQLNHAFFCVP